MQETSETPVPSLGWEDPLEEGTATHSSILAWKIPRTEEPVRLQSMGRIKVGLNPATRNRSISKDHTQVCVCLCVCLCISSRRLGVCLGIFMYFCLCIF